MFLHKNLNYFTYFYLEVDFIILPLHNDFIKSFNRQYLVFDTQMLIGNKKNKISEEEYVYAALQLYVDVVQIFLAILQITGAVSK